jgi:RimJ/RimL family protein N-acetyltransferase
MAPSFPALPPRDQLVFEGGDLVLRPPEASDAQDLFDLLTDPRMTNVPDGIRPASVEQLEAGFARLEAAAQGPTERAYWLHVVDGRVAGVTVAKLRFLDKDGRTNGPLLRTAEFEQFRSVDVPGRAVSSRTIALLEPFLVRHFGIEQLIAFVADDNEPAKKQTLAAGFEGPLHHDHDEGLGLYRRRPQS